MVEIGMSQGGKNLYVIVSNRIGKEKMCKFDIKIKNR
jgi:hypothetical protein